MLFIEDGDIDIDLMWDFPNPNCEDGGTGDGGTGDGGTTDGGQGECAEGEVPDCADDDCCPESWIGDGFPDCEDQQYGCDLTCYDNDAGDCDGAMNNHNDGTKEHLHSNNTSARIEGYNIYRDNIEIAWVPTEQNTYTDTSVMFGEEYCYKVKAVYEEGESNPTNEECGSVTNPEDFSVIGIEDGIVQSGMNVSLSIELENQFEVAGFQFTLVDSPNYLTVTSTSTTERTQGFTVEFNEQTDGSVIFVGFNITGGVITEGAGSILDIVFEAEEVSDDTSVEIEIENYYLGDDLGNEIPIYSDGGTVIILTEPISETLSIDLNPFIFNNVSFNVLQSNMSFESISSSLDMLLAVDGNSNFFVPDFGIDQIGDVDLADGF